MSRSFRFNNKNVKANTPIEAAKKLSKNLFDNTNINYFNIDIQEITKDSNKRLFHYIATKNNNSIIVKSKSKQVKGGTVYKTLADIKSALNNFILEIKEVPDENKKLLIELHSPFKTEHLSKDNIKKDLIQLLHKHKIKFQESEDNFFINNTVDQYIQVEGSFTTYHRTYVIIVRYKHPHGHFSKDLPTTYIPGGPPEPYN